MDEKCDQGKDMGIGFQVYTPYVELGNGPDGNWSFFLENVECRLTLWKIRHCAKNEVFH